MSGPPLGANVRLYAKSSQREGTGLGHGPVVLKGSERINSKLIDWGRIRGRIGRQAPSPWRLWRVPWIEPLRTDARLLIRRGHAARSGKRYRRDGEPSQPEVQHERQQNMDAVARPGGGQDVPARTIPGEQRPQRGVPDGECAARAT